MDGYAVRHEAVAGASASNPVELRVVGHLAAESCPRSPWKAPTRSAS